VPEPIWQFAKEDNEQIVRPIYYGRHGALGSRYGAMANRPESISSRAE